MALGESLRLLSAVTRDADNIDASVKIKGVYHSLDFILAILLICLLRTNRLRAWLR